MRAAQDIPRLRSIITRLRVLVGKKWPTGTNCRVAEPLAAETNSHISCSYSATYNVRRTELRFGMHPAFCNVHHRAQTTRSLLWRATVTVPPSNTMRFAKAHAASPVSSTSAAGARLRLSSADGAVA